MTTIKETGNDAEDLYSDLPNFQFEDTVKNLEQVNKALLNEKQKLQQRIEELEKVVEETQKDKSEIQKKNCNLSFNISSLYRTAKREIERKDNKIQELRKLYDDEIFRRRNQHNRRDSYNLRNHERHDDNKAESHSLDRDRHRNNSTKLQEQSRPQDIDDEDKRNILAPKFEDGKTSEQLTSKTNDLELSKKVLSEISDNPESALSSVVLTNTEVNNLQKALQGIGVNIREEKRENEPNVRRNSVPPKLNTPLTAYTRRMYKKHYGVSPEKITTKGFSANEKKEEFNVESKSELLSSTAKNNDVLPKEGSEENKVDIISNGGKKLNEEANTSQDYEENIESNIVKKNVRRISRVRKKLAESSLPSSDLIKLGSRSISKTIIEQRKVTSPNKLRNFKQLITPPPIKHNTSISKHETSSSMVMLTLNLEDNKNKKEDKLVCKVTPDETIESVLSRAKSISPKTKESDLKPKPQFNTFGRLKNSCRNKTTVINPVTTFSNHNKSNDISVKKPAENITLDEKQCNNKVSKEVEVEKLKVTSQRKSRQAQFLDSLFESPRKFEHVKESGKNESKHSESINNKSFEKIPDVKSLKTSEVNSNEELPLDNLNKSIAKRDSQIDELASSEVLTKVFQFQVPETKSDSKTFTTTQFVSECGNRNVDNNALLAVDQNDNGMFKTSPQNSMSAFLKITENSCLSASDDTIGMVTKLARVRTQISPIKTPIKKIIAPIESGDENASSPKIITRAKKCENVDYEENKLSDNQHFASVSTSVNLTQSLIKNTSCSETSEHCEFRRSKRIIAIVKRPDNTSLSLSSNKSPSFKRKLNMSDSSSDIVHSKKKKIEETVEKNYDKVKRVLVSTAVNKKEDVESNKGETSFSKLHSKQISEEMISNNIDTKFTNDHTHLHAKSPSRTKNIKTETSQKKREPENSSFREEKSRYYDSPSPRHDRSKRNRSSNNRSERQRSMSKDSEERDFVNCKRRSFRKRKILHPRHRIFSSGHRSSFQRHSPSEFFNRKEKHRRRSFNNESCRHGSPNLDQHRNFSSQRTRYSPDRKRMLSDERKDKKYSKDSRREITKSATTLTPNEKNHAELEKEQNIQSPTQPNYQHKANDPNWKLTLISIDNNKKTEPTPSPSIETGRLDPRMNVSSSNIDCSQEIKLNKILCDQNNQSNQINSPDSIKPMTVLSTPEKQAIKTPLIIRRSHKRNIKFGDNTSVTSVIQKEDLKEQSSEYEATQNKSPNVTCDKKLLEIKKTVDQDIDVQEQNICALTTKNIQKLNETLPVRCSDNSSIHPTSFQKKIVKTPLDFRQKYGSVFTNSDSDEPNPFDDSSESDGSQHSDNTWKP